HRRVPEPPDRRTGCSCGLWSDIIDLVEADAAVYPVPRVLPPNGDPMPAPVVPPFRDAQRPLRACRAATRPGFEPVVRRYRRATGTDDRCAWLPVRQDKPGALAPAAP